MDALKSALRLCNWKHDSNEDGTRLQISMQPRFIVNAATTFWPDTLKFDVFLMTDGKVAVETCKTLCTHLVKKFDVVDTPMVCVDGKNTVESIRFMTRSRDALVYSALLIVIYRLPDSIEGGDDDLL